MVIRDVYGQESTELKHPETSWNTDLETSKIRENFRTFQETSESVGWLVCDLARDVNSWGSAVQCM